MCVYIYIPKNLSVHKGQSVTSPEENICRLRVNCGANLIHLTFYNVCELLFSLCLKNHFLTPVDLLSVYGVALARRSSRNVYFGNLGGRRSCHGPVYSPAGWVLPVLSIEHNKSAPCEPNKGTAIPLKISGYCFYLDT